MGLEALLDNLTGRMAEPAQEGDTVIVRARHLEAFSCCQEAIREVLGSPDVPLDLRCQTLEQGARALGRIIGRDVDAAVVEKIFSEFCIGK